MQAAVGTAVITPQRRSKRVPQGSVSSLWTGVSKFHYPPCCHRVPACQSRLKVCVDRSASLSVHLLKLASWRRTFYRCSHGFCACNTVYSILKVREGDGGKRTFHLTRKISRFYPLFWPSPENFFQEFLWRGAESGKFSAGPHARLPLSGFHSFPRRSTSTDGDTAFSSAVP